MIVDDKYKYQHCRAELSRGWIERCPTEWLRTSLRMAYMRGDHDMVRAVSIALGANRDAINDMRRAAKRSAQATNREDGGK